MAFHSREKKNLREKRKGRMSPWVISERAAFVAFLFGRKNRQHEKEGRGKLELVRLPTTPPNEEASGGRGARVRQNKKERGAHSSPLD